MMMQPYTSMYKVRKNRFKGFTLIEVLLYMALMAAVVTTITVSLQSLLIYREKQRAMTEVEEQGWQVMQIIREATQNATSLTTPSTGSGSTLVLASATPSRNPTTFQVASGAITITENTTTTPLTNTWVTASAFSVTKLTSGTRGTVQIQFTLTAGAGSTRSEQQYTKTFTTSATVRL